MISRERTGIGRVLVGGLLVVSLTGSDCNVEPEVLGGDWSLTWEDTFDGPAGASPDAAHWQFDIGTNWGNEQLEYDTDRTQNVSLDGNGNLAITAREENYLGSQYTSGRIKTQGLFSGAYGRFEARIRLPVGQGIWPAFWLLGSDFQEKGWPGCGEIDIMEYRGQSPTIVHGTLHGPGYSGGSGVGGYYRLSESFNDDFHVFAIEWSRNTITWFVDDFPYQTLTSNDLPPGATWVFDHPFFIILNVAVGGHFVGPPNQDTVFPQTMLIDWVRVSGAQG